MGMRKIAKRSVPKRFPLPNRLQRWGGTLPLRRQGAYASCQKTANKVLFVEGEGCKEVEVRPSGAVGGLFGGVAQVGHVRWIDVSEK